MTVKIGSSAPNAGQITDFKTTFEILGSINPVYTGTLTGGTGVVNLGSGQFVKDASGNLGLGTTGTTQKLRINTAVANGGDIQLKRGGFIGFSNAADNSNSEYIYANGGALEFGTNATTKATLDTSGNLGLGVTPSAWGSNFKALQVGIGAALYGRTVDQNQVGLLTNAYFDTAFKYVGTGQAALYQQDDGAHFWYIAPSGTAGNAISFNQAMTLDASGNLLVNRAGTSGLGKLNVDGGADFTNGNVYIGRDSGNLLVGTGTSSGKLTVGDDANGSATVKISLSTATTERGFLSMNGSTGEMRLSAGFSGYGGFQTFYANGAERARIDASGNLGVGTSGSSFKIDALSTSSCVIRANGGTGTGQGGALYASTGGTTVAALGDASAIVGGAANTTAMLYAGSVPLSFHVNNGERARIDASGNLIQTVNTTAATLTTNGTLTFSIVDNSTLRISVRGSDGTTRTATVALA